MNMLVYFFTKSIQGIKFRKVRNTILDLPDTKKVEDCTGVCHIKWKSEKIKMSKNGRNKINLCDQIKSENQNK